jgi:hypothetical protein
MSKFRFAEGLKVHDAYDDLLAGLGAAARTHPTQLCKL